MPRTIVATRLAAVTWSAGSGIEPSRTWIAWSAVAASRSEIQAALVSMERAEVVGAAPSGGASIVMGFSVPRRVGRSDGAEEILGRHPDESLDDRKYSCC
jgi:hypothetical protein